MIPPALLQSMTSLKVHKSTTHHACVGHSERFKPMNPRGAHVAYLIVSLLVDKVGGTKWSSSKLSY